MKLILENWREYLKESLEDKSATIKAIHKLADDKGITWDKNAKFMEWTEELTGKSHLDDMTSEELEKVRAALEKRGSENK